MSDHQLPDAPPTRGNAGAEPGVSLARRRALLRGAGKAAPVVAASVVGVPMHALAEPSPVPYAVCIKPSGFYSISTFQSRFPANALACTTSQGPVYWSQQMASAWPQVNGASLADAKFIDTIAGGSDQKLEIGIDANTTLLQVLQSASTTKFARMIVAAYVNTMQASVIPNWPLTVNEVTQLWSYFRAGTFASNPWGWTSAETALQYLGTLMPTPG